MHLVAGGGGNGSGTTGESSVPKYEATARIPAKPIKIMAAPITLGFERVR